MGHYPELLELHLVVPEEDGEFYSELHEDDGLSDAYTRGSFLRTTFCVARQGARVRITVKAAGEGFPEFRRKKLQLVFHGGTAEPAGTGTVEVRAHGGRFEFDNAGEEFDLAFSV